jgi:hypothetical protein
VHTRIVQAIRDGNFQVVAAEVGGVGESTFYRWLQQGEAEPAGIYKEFWEAVTRARYEAEQDNVANVQKAARGHDAVKVVEEVGADGQVKRTTTTWREYDWRAAAWYLERSFPERWGHRQKLEHTGKDGGPIEFEPASEDVMRRMRRVASRLGTADGGTNGDGA